MILLFFDYYLISLFCNTYNTCHTWHCMSPADISVLALLEGNQSTGQKRQELIKLIISYKINEKKSASVSVKQTQHYENCLSCVAVRISTNIPLTQLPWSTLSSQQTLVVTTRSTLAFLHPSIPSTSDLHLPILCHNITCSRPCPRISSPRIYLRYLAQSRIPKSKLVRGCQLLAIQYSIWPLVARTEFQLRVSLLLWQLPWHWEVSGFLHPLFRRENSM